MSWAAAHPADELTHVDSVRHRPRRYLFAVNRVGQVTQGLVGYLGQSCLAQNVSHMLPGQLHGHHLVCKSLCEHKLASGQAGRPLASYRLQPVLVRVRP